jgi:hypothetical protein
MSDSLIPRDLVQRVRVLQMIWVALLVMCLLALGLFWYLHDQQMLVIEWREDVPIALILAGAALVLVVLSLILPDYLAHQIHPEMRPSFNGFQVACLVRGALLEAAVIMQAVAYLIEGEWWSLALGGSIALLMLGALPTRDTATRWIHRQDHLR